MIAFLLDAPLWAALITTAIGVVVLRAVDLVGR